MVRPRLVEEGVPIGSTLQNNDDNDSLDEVMEEDDEPTHRVEGGPSSSNQSQMSSLSSRSNNPSTGTSSLMRAAKGGPKPRASKSTTHTIIGGDASNKTNSRKPEAMHQPWNPSHSRTQHTSTIGARVISHPTYHNAPSSQQHASHTYQATTRTPYHAGQTHAWHPSQGHATSFTIGDNNPSVTHAHTAGDPMNTAYHEAVQPPHHQAAPNSWHNTHSQPHATSFTIASPQAPTPTLHPTPTYQNTSAAAPSSVRRTVHEIGADYRPTERMEGVEDHSIKSPLVVLDGANVAYAYASSLQGPLSSGKPQPDARGIQVACAYLQAASLRVLVVLPASWMRSKPRAGDWSSDKNALMQTDQLQVLQDLQQAGLLVASPPTDDDDAYALTIAQREHARAAQRGHGPAYVLSNDLFRDATSRDGSGQLQEWLRGDDTLGPGRISFAFCDMGKLDDHGERELDLVANPRHPLIQYAEQTLRQKGL